MHGVWFLDLCLVVDSPKPGFNKQPDQSLTLGYHRAAEEVLVRLTSNSAQQLIDLLQSKLDALKKVVGEQPPEGD